MIAVTEPTTRLNPRADISAASMAIPIRVLAVDDHPAVRMSLRLLLEEQADFEVVDVVASPEAAISLARHEPIDVAVIDYQLGGRRNGLWLSRKLKQLRRPPRVLVYSAYCDGLLAAASVVAQADGIVSKGGLGSELCDAVRSVSRGRLPLPIVQRQLAETVLRRLDQDERIIFGMLLAGTTLEEAGARLAYPGARLESRLSAMLDKLEPAPRKPAAGYPILMRHEHLVLARATAQR
jgi:DNA-binding NarL/FixJ family response regulator